MTSRTNAIEGAGLRKTYGDHELFPGAGQGSHEETHAGRPTGDEDQTGRGDWPLQHFTVHHDGVTIPVSRGGQGRPVVLCPGLNSTQADLHELIELLRRDHDVVTFDLRGHGLASAAVRYSFDAFLGDLVAVLGELDLPTEPVLVGYSLGADLAVHYAAECPDTVAGLVLIDGANPLPEPFITVVDMADFRAMADDLVSRQETQRAKGAAHQVLLTAQNIHDLNLEVDAVRSAILDRYRKIDHPIRMIMSKYIAGNSVEGRAPRHNQIWRAGIARLIRERPYASTCWLDADHRLVFTHASEIANIIRSGPLSRQTGF
ncbi:alpha/beta fold hydrolase [Streptomyces sp. NBC_00690]|uniref:alpha/beta fold hydrolase n=1 Tax=Streptomyces sp. NBC_00690 TaxID=2975808 RepID=UPI002E2D4E0F|nr:alpha/beta hydrolase [Streptomyces sp. NBC_00690]